MNKAEAAKAMGMKLREVVDVRKVAGGHAVTTHDGVVTLVTPEGGFLPYTAVAAAEEAPKESGKSAEPAAAVSPSPPADPGAEGDVPDGTEKDVLAWVGDSPSKAELALAAENAKESPRKGLVDKLGKLVG